MRRKRNETEESEIDKDYQSKRSKPDKKEDKTDDLNIEIIPQKARESSAKDSPINWTDGERIFVNKLGLYSSDSCKPNFLSFYDMLHPGLGKKEVKNEKVEKVILSTFVYDGEIIEKLITASIPICIILHQEGSGYPKLKKDSTHSNVLYAFPMKAPGLHYGIFHAKLILVQFSSFVRVGVTSANLTIVDWTLLSQVIWLQDFPKTSLSITETERQPFFSHLNDFLAHCFPKNYSPPINIYNYDFSKAAVDLVVSISGRFQHPSMSNYGFPRIGNIVQNSDCGFTSKPSFTYQTSSIGQLKHKYMSDFYQTVIGCKSISTPMKELSPYIQIQFPTKEYIENTVLGPEAAGCVLLSKKAFEDKEFPIDCLYRLCPIETHESYKRMLFHAKVLILASDQKIADDTLIYIGSHNISAVPGERWKKMIPNYASQIMSSEWCLDPKRVLPLSKSKLLIP